MNDFIFAGRILLALALLWQAGILVLLVLAAYTQTKFTGIEWLCITFGIGVGAITFEMVILALVGLDLSVAMICLPWLGFWLLWVKRQKSWGWHVAEAWRETATFVSHFKSPKEWLLLGAIGLLIALVLFRATFFPIFEWDGWAIWDLKARAFFYQRDLLPLVADEYYQLAHLDYPVLFPLAGTFIYLFLEHPSNISLILPGVFYASLLGLLFASLRRCNTPSSVAGLLTFGLACMPNVLFWSTQFYAEVPLAYYSFGGALSFALYLREKQAGWLILASLMFGLATQTKIEGLFFIIPALVTLGLQLIQSKENRLASLKALSIFITGSGALYAPWFIYRNFFGLSAGTLSWASAVEVIQQSQRFSEVLLTFVIWLSRPDYQNYFFLIFATTFLLCLVNPQRWRAWPFVYLLFQVGFTLVPYLVFFMAEPVWLDLHRLGRYLTTFTVMSYGLFAVQVSALFRSCASRAHSLTIQRSLVGLLAGLIIFVEIGLDIWPGYPTTPLFTNRPISLIRQVYSEAAQLINLTPAERQQWFNFRQRYGSYGRLIEVARALTPPTENVAIYILLENENSNYLRQRSYYLLYPRKVFILHTPSEIQPESLRALGVTTVIVYNRELAAGELLGQLAYQENVLYSLARINATAESLPNNPAFVPVSVKFENGIELLGYQLIPPLLNDPGLVTLFWRAKGAVTESFTAFVHVLTDGQLAAQHDGLPVLGQLPTQFWTPSQLVTDAHPLPAEALTRPDAQICVGLYASNTGERLPIMTSDPPGVENNTFCFRPN